MRETGSNILDISLSGGCATINGRRSSVRGRSLCEIVREDRPEGEFDRVVVRLDTSDITLVPQLYFDAPLAEGYLSVNNLLPAGSTAVRSVHADVVVVAACDRKVVEFLRSKYGEVEFVTPFATLLSVPEEGGEMIKCCVTDDSFYVAVWKDGLQLAQVFSCDGEVDVIYYLSWLVEKYDIGIAISGASAKLRRAVDKVFKKVVYEDYKW